DVPARLIVEAGRRLTDHYVQQGWEPFHSAGLCLYRTGDDSVAWHGDRFGRGASRDVLVAILSLGSPRRLALRPRGGGTAISLSLSHGDLLVMGGSCQRTYDHCIPKTRSDQGPRISVQFRPTGVA
ncbi:MAG: alpha-ketoglutarate-dependent dioxygenase AlkB, partial [Planctomycetaceae bacterium]